jgi:hypothetical protein
LLKTHNFFWKPASFPSSGKKASNPMDPLDQAVSATVHHRNCKPVKICTSEQI